MRRETPDADDGPEPQRTSERAALAETRAIYRLAGAAYSAFSCLASGECCQLTARNREPWLWPSEWRLLLARGPVPPPRPDGGCPFLDESGKRCAAYADRAFGCRTYFCARRSGPSREPGDEVQRLLRRLEKANQQAWPEVTGPRRMLELAALPPPEPGSGATNPWALTESRPKR